MMVLRHIGPPSCTIVSREDEEDIAAPIDLSKKHVPIEVPHRHSSNHNKSSPYISIVPSIAHSQNRNVNILRNTEQNNNRVCAISGSGSAPNGDVRWRELSFVQPQDEDNNSYSSPDSGLQRDSPGEDDELAGNSATPPLRSRRPNLIPLSLIRARYQQNHRTTSESSNNGQDEDSSNAKPYNAVDQVKTKRARLEEMVSHIKQVNPKKSRSQRLSGDDDTSSGGNATSSDEIADECPTDLRSTSYRSESLGDGREMLTMPHDIFRLQRSDGDEPCNLAYPKAGSESPMQEGLNPMDLWKGKIPLKNMPPLSPAEAAKLYGVDPETYQQQIMQLHLTSAAMMGDPGGLLKAIGNYPPWVYLGYYSQLIQNFQAQEFIRQYAMQSQSATTPTPVTQGDKSPSVPGTTILSSGYTCQSPASPTSLSEGPTGMDSDGSVVGQSTPGSANGKRAPRAMTGRHVRTGTGASPSTLQTLREKIEERQRLKAQQAQGIGASQQSPSSKGKLSTNSTSFLNNNNVNVSNNNKPTRKSRK